MTIGLWISGGVLVVCGLVLAAWALFGDRSRARRCRRCWYWMEGVPGLVCPECGWEAKREAQLVGWRPRRRWAWSGLLLVLVGVGVAFPAWVGTRQGGWWSLAPTFVLMEAIEHSERKAVRDALWGRIDDGDPAETIARAGALGDVGWAALAARCREIIQDRKASRDARAWATVTLGCVIPEEGVVDPHIEALLTSDRDMVREDVLGGVYPYYLQRGHLSDRWLDEMVGAASDVGKANSARHAMGILCRTSPLEIEAAAEALVRAGESGAIGVVWPRARDGLAHPRIGEEERTALLERVLASPRATDGLRRRVEAAMVEFAPGESGEGAGPGG